MPVLGSLWPWWLLSEAAELASWRSAVFELGGASRERAGARAPALATAVHALTSGRSSSWPRRCTSAARFAAATRTSSARPDIAAAHRPPAAGSSAANAKPPSVNARAPAPRMVESFFMRCLLCFRLLGLSNPPPRPACDRTKPVAGDEPHRENPVARRGCLRRWLARGFCSEATAAGSSDSCLAEPAGRCSLSGCVPVSGGGHSKSGGVTHTDLPGPKGCAASHGCTVPQPPCLRACASCLNHLVRIRVAYVYVLPNSRVRRAMRGHRAGSSCSDGEDSRTHALHARELINSRGSWSLCGNVAAVGAELRYSEAARSGTASTAALGRSSCDRAVLSLAGIST